MPLNIRVRTDSSLYIHQMPADYYLMLYNCRSSYTSVISYFDSARDRDVLRAVINIVVGLLTMKFASACGGFKPDVVGAVPIVEPLRRAVMVHPVVGRSALSIVRVRLRSRWVVGGFHGRYIKS